MQESVNQPEIQFPSFFLSFLFFGYCHCTETLLITGIVPSTPTLFPPRRSDGFGEAVSSPHVPTGSRFTYESAPSNNSGSTEVIPEQTLEFSHTDDNSMCSPFNIILIKCFQCVL